MDKFFKYEGKEYKFDDQDLIKIIDKHATKILKCRKDRYGFFVTYKVNNTDPRDGNEVNRFIDFMDIVRKLKL